MKSCWHNIMLVGACVKISVVNAFASFLAGRRSESLVVVITTTNYHVQGARTLIDKLIVVYVLEAVVPANAQ